MAKKVLILSSVHPLGHPRNTQKLARGLAEEGFEVELWARGEAPRDLPPNLQVHPLPKHGKLTRLLDLPAMLLRAVSGGHDLVVVVPPETVPLGLVAKAFGKRVLWDVEEDAASAILHSDWIPRPLRRPLAALYRLFEWAAVRVFDGCSIAEDGYMPRFGRARRVEVIHNYPPAPPEGIDLSRGETAERRWSLPGPRLIYVGSVTEHRGVLDVLEAVRLLETRLPDITFDVVGGIPRSDYLRRLERARAQFRDPSRITLHGQVDFSQLNDHLARAQIGLLPLWPQPNHRVSLQTKLFEYALAGLPTVVGDIPLWRTIQDRADSGEAAVPRDPESWADAIERLWRKGPHELRRAGTRAHDLVVEEGWFWERERKRLAELAGELAGRPKR